MSPALKRRLRWLGGGLIAAFVAAVLAWVFAPAILVVDSGVRKTDAVVVLGGEPWTRPKRAAEVYREVNAEMLKAESKKQALETPPSDLRPPTSSSESVVSGPLSRGPIVIVSGNGDCEEVRRQMVADGVPASVIQTECESRSTWENARFSVKLLRAQKATNVVLVTSWFHARRSLACFQRAAPEIHFFARPTPCPPSGLRHPDAYTLRRVFQEYVKVAYYWVVYGVPPWLKQTK